MKTAAAEREEKVSVMVEHLDDVIWDLVQTINSFEELHFSKDSVLYAKLVQAKHAIIGAREEASRESK